jgi:mono/diheme cytochrome c family protein
MRAGSSVIRVIFVFLVACGAWSVVGLAGAGSSSHRRGCVIQKSPGTTSTGANTSRADGLAAWQQVYSVLTSPRCINCHTATNFPQQGDDRHRHFANVVRGPEGKGVAALQCVTCHQDANADSTGVPGGHDWHLAPLAMKWQDMSGKALSSAAVCRAVTDRSKNNNRDGAALLKHHEEEPLVLWAFQPGRRIDGGMRTLPPMTHAEFVAATRKWVEAGTPCPQIP